MDVEAFRTWTADHLARGEHVPGKVLDRRVEATFVRLSRWLRPSVCLEVGAHEAGFSRRIKRQLPDTRVVAFEANPFVYEKYADTVAPTGVEYLNYAVASSSGTAELLVPRELRTRSLSRVNKIGSLARNRGTVEQEVVIVPAVTLDEHLALGASESAVAWIDVEGASREVLLGARETLTHAGFVYLEVERTVIWEGQWIDTDVASFLGGFGLVPILRDRQRPNQYNLLFAHRVLAGHPWVARQVARAYRSGSD